MLRDEIQATLNDLIRLCGDARERYEQAAAEAPDAGLAALFQELAQQRDGICRELRGLDRRLGDLPHARDPDRSTTRTLLSRLKARLSADENHALLQVCEEADAELAEGMGAALERQDLPAEVREAILRLRCEVTAAMGRLAAARTRL